MAEFLPAVQQVLRLEGANYTDLSQDKGGSTKFGITQNYDYEDAVKLKLIPPGTQIKNITQEQAIAIYKKLYWDACPNLNNISNQKVANKLFSSMVNIGIDMAVYLLQETLDEFIGCRLKLDGDFGTRTINAVNDNISMIVLNFYKQTLCKYYEHLVERNPKDEVFLKGWLNRANS